MPRDSKGKTPTRRRFLKATGTVAVASAVAGCGDGGDGTTTGGSQTTAPPTDQPGGTDEPATDSPGGGTDEPTTDEPSGAAVDFDQYPYGPGETMVGEAKRVMEEAGYGPNNRYSLDWIQYTSPAWKEMANTIRARLSSAYVDMNISEVSFAELQNQGEKGTHEAYTLGWIADYPHPKNFVQLFDPPNTDYSSDPLPNGAMLWWSDDAKVDQSITDFQKQQYDRIENNPEPSDEATAIRDDAAMKMEEGNWAAAGLIPIYHRFDEFFWYDHVDYEPPGGMGSSRAKTSRSVKSIEGKNRLSGSTGTLRTLDPAFSGSTTSGAKVMNVYDAPMNYANGTTEVENLLVRDYSISDDLTEYEFQLKEGVQFHGDWGEVTADDVVYSFRRVMESENSHNTYFTHAVLNIERETDDNGNIVPGSPAVEKTGEYSFKLTLRDPFAYALPVLAYSAFSVIPEGIVGDIEGYEGEMSYEEFSTSNPIGTGPFEFEKWESGDGGEVVLNRYPGYHNAANIANFQGIDDAVIVSPSASHNYFLNKNADLSGIPTSKYDPNKVTVNEQISGGRVLGEYGPMSNGETVNYGGVPTINTFYVGFNMEKVPWAVRKAMAYVVNQDQFVQSVFKGRGEPAYHLQPKQVIKGGAQGYTSHYQG